jgi:ketosteroid isomerase-like protein
MASRSELALQLLEYQRSRDIDKAAAMLAEDVVTTNPMQGTVSGKAAVEERMRAAPPGGGGMELTWSEPQEEGDTVTLLGSGSPFGTIKVVLTFNADDQISRIEAGLA